MRLSSCHIVNAVSVHPSPYPTHPTACYWSFEILLRCLSLICLQIPTVAPPLSLQNGLLFLLGILVSRESLFPPLRTICLSELLAGINELDHVDVLLQEHDGERADGKDPRDS